jgi:hypothetical protein
VSEHDPSIGEHKEQMRRMHLHEQWAHYVVIGLGLWLASSPFAFGLFDVSSAEQFGPRVLEVGADRDLADPALRSLRLAWSDLLSGLLIALFGALSLSRRFGWAQWANAAVGSWVLFAPLLFWSPGAAAYTNDTLVGGLVIAFAVLIPMMPGMSHAGMMDRCDRPPGWTYSPSSWLQRLPIIALGLFGLLIARWLCAYQLGHVGSVWEPFFPGRGGQNGTEQIITSDVSKAWPIADAGLGAVSYMFEVLMGAMGDARRWRTMPWMVAGFVIVVVPLGVVSIWFIVIQPITIGTWCTLCLLTALLMLIMMPFALDELVAMVQFMRRVRARGEPFWRTFFRGGAEPDGEADGQPGFDAPLPQAIGSAIRGVTLPWTLALSIVLGIGLMFSRILFDTAPPLAHSDHLVGAMVVTVSVLASAEVARPLRYLNLPFGLWLLAAPWLLDGGNAAAAAANVMVGLLLIGLSLPRGARSPERYGGWDRYIV